VTPRQTVRNDRDGLSVSVIVIARNAARFIAQALASIALSQAKPLEILVVDGGSTDDTVAIASCVPDVTIVRQASTGIANAYNEGVARARGEVLAFLSSDDIWLPGKLDRHLSALAENRELLLSVSLVEHFLEPGSTLPAGFRTELFHQVRPGFLMEALVARKRAFDIVGAFDPQFATAEDTDWYARAIDAGLQIEVIRKVLVRKRIHSTNASLMDADGDRNRLRALHASLARKRASDSTAT